ncbi:Indoleamine 2,3-dioxygenase 1 [Tulasnella sp. 418]|nr:Indoleamine 2,3-dioxygenase 1 [Tulasnella sp. 418]
MPGPHVQFLQDIKLLPSIREFVRNSDQRSLTDAYNGALESFKEFRSEHFKLVALYIIGPSKKETKSGKDGEGLVGTGGSDLSSLLKGMRADTLEVKLGKQE